MTDIRKFDDLRLNAVVAVEELHDFFNTNIELLKKEGWQTEIINKNINEILEALNAI